MYMGSFLLIKNGIKNKEVKGKKEKRKDAAYLLLELVERLN